MSSVLQPWVQQLSLMQQTVLLTALRGPDGVSKNHIIKQLLRWYRRCVLVDAFAKRTLTDPYERPHGGSFTGPVETCSVMELTEHVLRTVDELPYHFQMHLMHAMEIVGYKHPDQSIRRWWRHAYLQYVRSLHLNPETEEQMDYRLGDQEDQWREATVEVETIGGHQDEHASRTM